MRRFPTLLSPLLLFVALGGCGIDVPSEDCAPGVEATWAAPDGRHVAQRWLSICGAPGATVADLVTVSEAPISRLPGTGVFIFIADDVGSRGGQISAAWVDNQELRITIDTIGTVMDSPRRVGNVVVSYALGPSAGLSVVEARKTAKINERQEWERLKTSSAWHWMESSYDLDAHLIEHYQKFIDWAKDNAEPEP